MGGQTRISFRLAAAALFALLLTMGAVSCGGGGDDPESPSASPAPPSAASLYVLSSDGSAVVRKGGTSISIRGGSLEGYVDNTLTEGKVVSVIGWAAAPKLGGPAKAVVGIVDGKAIAMDRPSEKRADVAEAYDTPALGRSGFVIRFEKSLLDCAQPRAGLTVLGIADGTAASLSWVGGSDKRIVEEAC